MNLDNLNASQDEIYVMLAGLLLKKGIVSEQQLNKAEGWNPEIERSFKEYCQFGLGITPPITVPHAVADFHPKLRVLFEELDMEAPSSSQQQQSAETEEGEGDSAPTTTPQFKVADNGDLNFAFQTGVNQVRPLTPDESLATEIKTSTDEVASEIASGEVVTTETLEADKAAEKAVEDEIDAEESGGGDAVEESSTDSEPDVQQSQTAEMAPEGGDSSSPTDDDVEDDDDLNIEGA